MTLEHLDLREKAEEATKKLKEKLKKFKVRPLVGTGFHVDPREMEKEFEKHTSADGKAPIGGAKDD